MTQQLILFLLLFLIHFLPYILDPCLIGAIYIGFFVVKLSIDCFEKLDLFLKLQLELVDLIKLRILLGLQFVCLPLKTLLELFMQSNLLQLSLFSHLSFKLSHD